MASDCSSCVQETSGYPCSWCMGSTAQCSISEECIASSSVPTLITMGTQCPAPTITSISPTSGPLRGGTIVTITGTDLGVTLSDFDTKNSIKIGEMTCIPLTRDYISGKQILCRTQNSTEVGRKKLIVNLTRHSGVVLVTSTMPFHTADPRVVSVDPPWGPIAGGSELTITGDDLNIGNSASVTLYGYSGPQCDVM